jgi:hypothetical protein
MKRYQPEKLFIPTCLLHYIHSNNEHHILPVVIYIPESGLGWFLLFPSTICLKVDIVAPRVQLGAKMDGWMNYCRQLGKKVEGNRMFSKTTFKFSMLGCFLILEACMICTKAHIV